MINNKQHSNRIPEGVAALFFIQIFATLGFAILYSTLVLYTTKKLEFGIKEATTIMGVFAAFNYGLHLFGGYLGGRFISNRNLFVGGMLLQMIGCATISLGTTETLFWGLGLFLTGCGLNVTCINMMLTQRFHPNDHRREAAFLWNYAGMNLGFFIGFSAAGHFQLSGNYSGLFIFATIGNFISIVLALLNWKRIADIKTPLMEVSAPEFRKRLVTGIVIMLGLVPLIYFMFHRAELTANLVLIISILIGCIMIWLTVTHNDAREKKNMIAYLLLTSGSVVFWTLFQMAPSGLQLFTESNVDRIVWGQEIAPQWIQNINSVVVMLGGPILATVFQKMRDKGIKIEIPIQFSAAILLIGVAFLLLPLGIKFAGQNGLVAFEYIFMSYILQSVGELLISPIGYAMIGKLAPTRYQGVMMGTWMLCTGTASILSSFFSGMVPAANKGDPVTTNPVYYDIFLMLGCGAVFVGIVMVLFIPFLRKLIAEGEVKDELPNAKLATN